MQTNKDKIVTQSVQGSISHPRSGRSPYRLDRDGKGHTIPGTGGITYNVRVGDPAFGWVGDHIEPGVSIKIDGNGSSKRDNLGLGLLACIGNEARVVSGDAEGETGYVTGLHGGIYHVLIDFEPEVMSDMKIGDDILVKACGQGLELEDFPEVSIFNIDPELFEKLGIKEQDNKLEVPVAAEVPGHLMGSGIGSASAALGDYDITTGDKEELEEYGLTELDLGDIIYLENCDNTYGREYRSDAGSIGIVAHSDCIKMGHGPGVTVIMSARDNIIEPVESDNANIASYLV